MSCFAIVAIVIAAIIIFVVAALSIACIIFIYNSSNEIFDSIDFGNDNSMLM